MEFLASDAMKGRGSGTEDEWRAATYIGSQMRRWGIEPLGDKGGFVKEIETGRAASAPTDAVDRQRQVSRTARRCSSRRSAEGPVSGLLQLLNPGTPAASGGRGVRAGRPGGRAGGYRGRGDRAHR